jgi:ATP-dependent RNA helicase DDX27
VQEFIRIRPTREHMRLAMLVELCTTICRHRCIIFFRSKVLAHKTRILFSLLNLKSAELHGALSQEQRVRSVELFRTSQVDFLLATDLASRGLDIKNVDTVINYEAPQSHEIYLHRVGRTARAGRSGRAVTLAGESDRKVVKAAVKTSKSAPNSSTLIAARVLPTEKIDALHAKITKLEREIDAILAEEKEAKSLSQIDMQIRKGENLITHQAEIQSRPQRSWFQSEAEKKKSAAGGGTLELAKKAEKVSGKKRRKLDGTKDREEGRVYKKTTAQRMEGQKRGSGVKTLMKKVKQKKGDAAQAKGKAERKNKIKMARKGRK